jgi:hypothetical protein
MSGDLVVRSNGPYLRVVLPDFALSWDEIRRAVDVELEDGIARAEIVAPSYCDEASLADVRRLAEYLEGRGVDAIVEWQGVLELAGVG